MEICWWKKVTIHVAFLKCHSDPKFRVARGKEADDINQKF